MTVWVTNFISHYCQADWRTQASRHPFIETPDKVLIPLLWKPYELRKYPAVARADWGIEPPRMYDLGYTHANCGGRCCKQGWGDWLRTLLNWPARYAEVEPGKNE